MSSSGDPLTTILFPHTSSNTPLSTPTGPGQQQQQQLGQHGHRKSLMKKNRESVSSTGHITPPESSSTTMLDSIFNFKSPITSTTSIGTPSTTSTPAPAGGHHSITGINSIPTSSGKSSEIKRKPSLNIILPKHAQNGSTDSLNKNPHSPGWNVSEDTPDDKDLPYKIQRKNYRLEKQRVSRELSTALKDPSIIILSGPLKVRGKLKGWTKLWAVLKPGLLLLYKSSKIKSSHWIATVLLHCCKVIERPSKKEGFCFKVFHPLEQSIWAIKGPEGETIGSVIQPLPNTYLICRAPSSDSGKYWLDGLELALTCSSLLVRPNNRMGDLSDDKSSENDPDWLGLGYDGEIEVNHHSEKSDSDTSHIEEQIEEEEARSQEESEDSHDPIAGGDNNRTREREYIVEEEEPIVDIFTTLTEEDFAHTKGEHSEVLGDENKSLLWFLLKQVRPGMDLSRVVLPTFILEPRSFLDKLGDYYYHVDILAKAVLEDDAFTRMKCIVKWYLSGFYKKPKGLKKPYNPVLGETFRCKWEHPNGSNTFFIAEQVSHHPPISAFYVTNKKEGFVITASILTKSKFYGNSTSAILEGQAILRLLPRGEEYIITMPFAHCKGLLLGTLSMELGGNVSISCEKTGYSTEIEFKLRSFLSRSDMTNAVHGKFKLGREVLATLDGHWDNKIYYKDKRTSSFGQIEEDIFWEVTDEVRAKRLKRFSVPFTEQNHYESEKLWKKVSDAINLDDQEIATVEKTRLEEKQRADAKTRAVKNLEWSPAHFVHDGDTWHYKYEDLRPWDHRNDMMEYEENFHIQTLRRHKTNILKSNSLISVDSKSCDIHRDGIGDQGVVPAFHQRESNRQLVELLRQLLARQLEQSEQISQLQTQVAGIQARLSKPKPPKDPFPITNAILAVLFAVLLQVLVVIFWFGDGKLIPDISRKRS